MKMANGAVKNNQHLSLHPAAVPTLCPTISNWRKRMAQDVSGTEKQGNQLAARNDDGFHLSTWFVDSLSKPPFSLHTHLINVGGKGLWEKADVAAGT